MANPMSMQDTSKKHQERHSIFSLVRIFITQSTQTVPSQTGCRMIQNYSGNFIGLGVGHVNINSVMNGIGLEQLHLLTGPLTSEIVIPCMPACSSDFTIASRLVVLTMAVTSFMAISLFLLIITI